jgi:hypothetical protein
MGLKLIPLLHTGAEGKLRGNSERNWAKEGKMEALFLSPTKHSL